MNFKISLSGQNLVIIIEIIAVKTMFQIIYILTLLSMFKFIFLLNPNLLYKIFTLSVIK